MYRCMCIYIYTIYLHFLIASALLPYLPQPEHTLRFLFKALGLGLRGVGVQGLGFKFRV